MGLNWRPHRPDHAWHGLHDHGAYVARVAQAGDRWHAHLTATGDQVGADHPTADAAMLAVDDHVDAGA
jgi:hypothetical protein